MVDHIKELHIHSHIHIVDIKSIYWMAIMVSENVLNLYRFLSPKLFEILYLSPREQKKNTFTAPPPIQPWMVQVQKVCLLKC